jgi:hypothetical protein
MSVQVYTGGPSLAELYCSLTYCFEMIPAHNVPYRLPRAGPSYRHSPSSVLLGCNEESVHPDPTPAGHCVVCSSNLNRQRMGSVS